MKSISNRRSITVQWLKFTAIIPAGVIAIMMLAGCSQSDNKPDSNINGVQIGVISYSWRNMPYTAEDVLRYCLNNGISSIELMGDVAERYAGLPSVPERPENFDALDEEDKETYRRLSVDARQKQREWRISNDLSAYKELRSMYNDAGVNIHIVKFAPAKWSDEEIDYAFKAARVMGAQGITNEIGHEACQRLGKFAEMHGMYAIYHNHGQPGDPGFDFEEFLAYSPNNMLNLDVGHYFGATGKHPNELIEQLHNRIFSIHLKDKTAMNANPPDTNMPWGEGDTPLEDILQLIRDNDWPIYCDIELEYAIPDDSDPVQETAKCVDYCRKALE